MIYAIIQVKFMNMCLPMINGYVYQWIHGDEVNAFVKQPGKLYSNCRVVVTAEERGRETDLLRNMSYSIRGVSFVENVWNR